MSNQQIKTNLETLLAAVEAQPDTGFNLNYFKKVEPCGTLFCTVGLACTMPVFQEMGFALRPLGRGLGVFHATLNGEHVDSSIELNAVFGENAYYRVFAGTECGEWDEEMGYEEDWTTGRGNMTHKALAVARLKKQIEIYSEEQ